MPLPLAPIAAFALRYGTVALASYAVARRIQIQRGFRDQHAEDAHDKVPEGMSVRTEPEQVNVTGRVRRVIRFGTAGPGYEVDATGFGRFRIRRV